MTAPSLLDPCFQIPDRPALRRGKRIRVVQVLATGTAGGAQEHVRNFLERIDRTRYDVLVIALSDGRAVQRIRATGFPVAVVPEADDDRAVQQVTDILAASPPDIVHNHMYRGEIVGTRAALALQERGLRKPYVIGTVHSSRIRSPEDRTTVRQLTPHMDRLIAVSRSICRKLEWEGRMTIPVDLIYNGVDLSRYDETEACCTLPMDYGFPEGTPLVGAVGRLEPEKGHQTLLEAWPLVLEKVPAARLLIVGEGSQREPLEDQAEALALLGEACTGDSCVGTRHARPGAKVIFTGLRDDIPQVTAALDVAVLPSYREAQGMVILEAMALRRPVVATNVGGIPEMIEDGVTGLLVPPHDAPALATAISRLLLDHPLADMLARAGHDQVHERFCIELMVQAIQTLYDEGAARIAGRSTRGLAASA
jgi:glycosyltransferase involved in cell wall biosynthesis